MCKLLIRLFSSSPHGNYSSRGGNCREQAWLLKNSCFGGNGQNFEDTKCLEIREDRLKRIPNAILFLRFSVERVFQHPQAIALKTAAGEHFE